MSNSYFQFKQFTIWQDKCAMKVGTDGVLLGAWAPIANKRRILDVGTGTGLVALMLAQRAQVDFQITALEVDQDAALQAQENIALSPWKSSIEVIQEDFTTYLTQVKYDLIVSNPPYFINSLSCPDHQRSQARHNDSLTYDILLKKVSTLLDTDGLFTVIIPADVSDSVKLIGEKNNLFPLNQLEVFTKPNGEVKRKLITFSFKHRDCKVEQLLTEVARHQYSDEYKSLTEDFYLHLK